MAWSESNGSYIEARVTGFKRPMHQITGPGWDDPSVFSARALRGVAFIDQVGLGLTVDHGLV
ncbi:MAG: hypothetical protein AAGJ52_12335, partial [Pseudomonadota bacterium]